MKKFTKLIVTFIFAVSILATVFYPEKTNAATKNDKAIAAYVRLMQQIKEANVMTAYRTVPEYPDIDYYYKDLTGDGVYEAVLFYKALNSGHGSSSEFKIYTYKNGAVKEICSDAIYGFEKLKYYKKSKSFVVWSYGHGYEHYKYFKYSKGKYKLVAEKWRQSVNGGGGINGPWTYCKGSKSVTTNAKTFKKKIKGIKKGKASLIKWENLQTY